MKFTINKTSLQKALTTVIGVVPSNSTISVLTCFLVEIKDSTIAITGTDLECAITLTLDVETEMFNEEESLAVPAKLLLNLLKQLPDIPVTLSSEKDKLTVHAGKGLYKIALQSYEDYPKLNIDDSKSIYFNIQKTVLQELFSTTMFSVSHDEMRPGLTGLGVEILKTSICVTGTDGHRLSQLSYSHIEGAEDKNFILPTKACSIISKYIDNDGFTPLIVGEDFVHFKIDNFSLYSKLIAGTYPNVDKVIPKDNDTKVLIDREEFISALKRISIFSDSYSHRVELKFATNEMVLTASSTETGANALESMAIDYAGDEHCFGFNHAYLLDVLNHCNNKTITFKFKDADSAVLILDVPLEDGFEGLFLLMPIRIEQIKEEEGLEKVDTNADVHANDRK